MSSMPTQNNPLSVAKESMAMSRESGDRTFRVMALIMMAGTGIAALLHAMHLIYRDMCPKREAREYGNPPPPPGYRADGEEPSDRGPQASWVHKARLSDRPAEGEKLWAERRSQQTHARQH